MSVSPKQKKTVAKPIVKKENKAKKEAVKRPEKPKASQEQNALGNRVIEQQALKAKKENDKETTKIVEALKGGTTEVITNFSDSSASAIAKHFPLLGENLNKNLEQELNKESKSIPKLSVIAGSKQIKIPTKTKLSTPKKVVTQEKLSEVEPAKISAAPHKETSKLPSNSKAKKMLKQTAKSGFLSWLKNNFDDFAKSIKTRDTAVSTSAGQAPSIDMSAKANPDRIAQNHTQAKDGIQNEQQSLSHNIVNSNAHEKVKPREVNESRVIHVDTKAKENISTVVDSGMQDYLAVELPVDMRKHSDELLQPAIAKSTEALKKNTSKIAQVKEDAKQSEIQESQKNVEALNVQANKEQEKIITARKKEVISEQQKSLNEAQEGVDEFSQKANKEQKNTKKGIDDKASKAKGDADKELVKGESKAKEIKKTKEAEAEQEKKNLEKEQEDKSWWDRAVDVVKSAVELLTKAIDAIFTALRSLVKAAIEVAKNLAVSIINTARTWIVEKLDAFREWAKSMVDKYLKEYFPKLAKLLNQAIDLVVNIATKAVNAVADGMIKGVEALTAALSNVLDKVLATFQTALKGAVQIVGAVLTGDFKEALKIAIQAVCDVLGVDSKPVFDFFKRAGKQMMKILKRPDIFFKNLITSVGNGIKGFAKNIKKHLITGLMGWLTGALSEAEITLPEKFDFKGVLSLVMQIIGATYENIKVRVVKKYPAAGRIFDNIEKGSGKVAEGFEVVKEIQKNGAIVLWKKVKAKMGDLKETVISAIRNFVIISVVKNGIIWLISLLNPASAIAKVVKLLFDFTMFLIERFEQIKDFVLSVYNSITAIASGALGKATKAVEDALARSLPVVISLMATLIGLGGIGKTVQKLIKKASKPVNKVIDAVIKRIVKFAKKLLGKGKGKNKKKDKGKKGKIDKTLGKELKFSAGREKHRLWIVNKGGKPQVMVASNSGPVDKLLKNFDNSKDNSKDIKDLIKEARVLLSKTATEAKEEMLITKAILRDNKTTAQEIKEEDTAEKDTIEKEKELQVILIKLFEHIGEKKEEFDKKLREHSEIIYVKVIEETKYKDLADNKKDFIKNRIGFIRKEITPFISNYIKEKKMSEFDEPLKKYFKDSLENKTKPKHNNFNPSKIKLTEKDGVYKVTYDTKSADGTKNSNFTIDISFEKITDKLPNVIQKRVVTGLNLANKPEGIGRGSWDSAQHGFDNAHIVGDQFGGSGKNYALNIHRSSPNYNRVIMAKVENAMAKYFKGIHKDLRYDLKVTAYLSDDTENPTKLKDELAKEFVKDNSANKSTDGIKTKVEKGMITRLKKVIAVDLKRLPAKFEKVKYKAESLSLDLETICKNKDKKKEEACKINTEVSATGQEISIKADADYEKLKDAFQI